MQGKNVMIRLNGDIKSKMDDKTLRQIFGRCSFNNSWVHPKNFKELMTNYEERKRKRMNPFTDDPKTPTEFDKFLIKWREQWKRVKKIAVKQFMKNRIEFYKNVEDERLALYERALKKRLKTCEMTGKPPKFLIKALLRKHERKNSYLNFLRRMKKAYMSQQKTDSTKLKKFISCLEKFLVIIDTEKRKKREMKMAKIKKTGSFDGEEAEEEDDFKRREISLKQLVKKHREKKKLNAAIIQTRNYTKEDFDARRFLKGPAKIGEEVKGKTGKQEVDGANKVPFSPDIDPDVFFMKWYSDDRKNSTEKQSQRTFKMDKRLGATKNFSIMNYMTMLKVAEMVERDPYDLEFLPNAGHYFKPFYYMPDGIDVPVRMMANFPKQSKNDDERGAGDVKEMKTENPFFSNDLIDVWNSRNKAPDRRKKQKVLDLVKEGATEEVVPKNKKNENHGGEVDDDPESAVNLEPEESETEGSEGGGDVVTNARSDDKPDKPWSCPQLQLWRKFQYDPYACLRKKTRISKKERSWYRSTRERERRSFMRGQLSFMKFIDINKLNCNPEKFKVWKMAASGHIYRGLKKVNPNYVKDENMHGVGEIWNWDNVGEGDDQGGMERQKSLVEFKSMCFSDQRKSDEKPENIGAQFIKTILEDIEVPVDHRKTVEEKEENDPPRSYVVFSSITLPPFVERRAHNRRQLHNDIKVEDRKLFRVLNSCGTLIFDITRSRHDLYLCCWYLRKLLLKIEKAEQLSQTEVDAKKKLVEKVFRNKKELQDHPPQSTEPYRPMQRIILITSFVSWAKSPDNVKAEMKEDTFYKRKPHPDYFDYYTCENLLYRIGRRKPYNIRTTVLFAGLPFGFEEDGLVYIFKMAYENRREIPIYGPGDNLPPMVHIHDLSKIVISLMKADQPPLIAFAVHPTDLPLKTRVFNIATQISYSHIRTQPAPEYLWNNVLPKTVHDMLQLNITPESVDNHPHMENPLIPNPFSPGPDGYQLLLELMQSRGMSPKTVLFLGPPTRMKLDLAESISVFYNIPLLTRRNIMKEWMKLLRQMQETNDLSNVYNKSAETEEPAEKDEEKVKTKDVVLEEMKQIVNDNNNCDVNRYWLLVTLQIILRTIRYRQIGYVLCDIPLSEKDAEFLFNNRTDKPELRPFDFVAETTVMPKTVIYMDTMKEDAHESLFLQNDKVMADDWVDFWKHRAKQSDAQEFFKKRLHKVHRVTTRDEFLLERVIEIIGAPMRPGGALMYQSLFSHMLEEKTSKPEEKAQVAHVRQFFNLMQQRATIQRYWRTISISASSPEWLLHLHAIKKRPLLNNYLPRERWFNWLNCSFAASEFGLMRMGLQNPMMSNRIPKWKDQTGLDLAAGITHQCLPSLTDWPKQNLKNVLQPYYVGFRHYPTKKKTLRSAAGPYREVRRKWSKKSRFFNQMPTDGNRVMWKKARKFWAPQEKTKEYIVHFEATSI